jgi:hypothetical protein
MKSKISLKSPVVQYVVGLAVNVAFVVILLSTDASYRNLQLPEGEYQGNIQTVGDVMGYVRLARNYLTYGVFGWQDMPDYHRTVGYPLFLALSIKLFGNNWLFWVFFVQAALYACIYPALSKIVEILFPDNPSLVVPAFCFYLISGAYIVQVPALLTDTFFTVLFTVGLCFGLLSIVKQSWRYLILQLVIIGYAAQVRPTLALYPFLNVFVLWLVASRYGVSGHREVKKMIIVSSVALLLPCNAPSIRNYVHYGFFAPADILSNNFFTYLGKETMYDNCKQDSYEEMNRHIKDMLKSEKETRMVRERMALQNKYVWEICRKYPATAVKRLAIAAVSSFLYGHWVGVPKYWGYSWRPGRGYIIDGQKGYFKVSKLVTALLVVWMVVYAVIYVFFLSFLVRLIKERHWLFLFTIFILVCYFLVPTFVAAAIGRMRLPVEGIIVICAFYQIVRMKYFSVASPGLKTVG